jgi:hypothetical protein
MNIIIPYITSKQKKLKENFRDLYPALLIMDGATSRRNIELWKCCIKNNIFAFILPSNSSHILQPLDLCITANIKNSLH